MPQPHAGPSGDAAWRPGAPDAAGRDEVLLLPDAVADPPLLYALPASPRLARRGDLAALGVTLLLRRTPDPGRESLASEVEGGELTLDATLGLEPATLAEQARREGAEVRPLFAQEVRYRLHEGEGDIWAEAVAAGARAPAALAVRLDRDRALRLLAILTGAGATEPRLRAEIVYRTAGRERLVRLRARWATLHDALRAQLPADAAFDRTALRRAVAGLAAAQLLVASVDEAGRSEALPFDDEFHALFLRYAAVILRRDPLDEDRYLLRERPHDAFHLDATERRTVRGLGRVELEAPLASVLEGRLGARPLEAYVRLVPLGLSPGAPPGVPRRRRAGIPRAARGPDGAERLRLAAAGGKVGAVHAALLPAVAATAVSRPLDPARPGLLALQPATAALHDDYVLELPGRDRPRNLPVLADPDAPLWPDRLDPGLRWYPPAFELLLPEPADAPEAAPFEFRFRRTGATQEGEPALEAELRLTLRRGMGAATRTAAAAAERAGQRLREAPLEGLCAVLELPFVDSGTGGPALHLCEAEVAEEGDRVRLIVRVRDDWVRLLYGALAEPGFQEQPARVRLAGTVRGYAPVAAKDLELHYGGKVRGLPVRYGEAPDEGRPVLDARSLAVRGPGLELRLARPEPRPAPRHDRLGPASRPVAGVLHATARPAPAALAAGLGAVKLRPPLEVEPALAAELVEVRYAQRSLNRVERVDALAPCVRYGAHYRETVGGAATAIGCRDALKLGETRYRLYGELVELARPEVRVLRSLQQPDVFLAVPARYRLARVVDEGEVRPGIMLYAVLDPDDASATRLTLEASLQPLLAPWLRRELLARLEAHAARPRLLFPTEIPLAGAAFHWALDGDVEATCVPFGVFVRAAFHLDVPDFLLLRTRLEATGLVGAATFALPDGETLTSVLELRLDAPTGPWDHGAVEARVRGRRVELRNRAEAPAEVAEIVHYGPAGRVPVELTLAPGAAHEVELDREVAEAYPVFAPLQGDPVTITELRAFMERIRQTVVFAHAIDLAAEGLAALDVEARLRGVEGEYRLRLDAATPVGEIEFALPLTELLSAPELEYRVGKVAADGTVVRTDWSTTSLEDGALVVLDRDRIA